MLSVQQGQDISTYQSQFPSLLYYHIYIQEQVSTIPYYSLIMLFTTHHNISSEQHRQKTTPPHRGNKWEKTLRFICNGCATKSLSFQFGYLLRILNDLRKGFNVIKPLLLRIYCWVTVSCVQRPFATDVFRNSLPPMPPIAL